MVPDGDLEEVPSDDDLQNKVDDGANDRVHDVVMTPEDNSDDAEHNGEDDGSNIEDLRDPDDLAGGFLVGLLEPLVPDPCVVESDERYEDGDEAGDDVDRDQQNAVDGVEDTAENG